MWNRCVRRWSPMGLWLRARPPPLKDEAYLRAIGTSNCATRSNANRYRSLLSEINLRDQGLLLRAIGRNHSGSRKQCCSCPVATGARDVLLVFIRSCHRKACDNVESATLSRSRSFCEERAEPYRPRAGFGRDDIFYGFPRHMQCDRRLNHDDNGFCAGPFSGGDT